MFVHSIFSFSEVCLPILITLDNLVRYQLSSVKFIHDISGEVFTVKYLLLYRSRLFLNRSVYVENLLIKLIY